MDHSQLIPKSSSEGADQQPPRTEVAPDVENPERRGSQPTKTSRSSRGSSGDVGTTADALRDDGGYRNPLDDLLRYEQLERRRSSQIVQEYFDSRGKMDAERRRPSDDRDDVSDAGIERDPHQQQRNGSTVHSGSKGSSDDKKSNVSFGIGPDEARLPRRQLSRESNDVVISRRKGMLDPVQDLYPSAALDHSPHDIFVELDELVLVNHEYEWTETARWIKYEENLEEGSNKWGPPHMSTLSFHSLLNLRKCLEQGVVLLDMEADDFSTIVHRVADQMVISDQLHLEQKGLLIRALMLRHHHVDEHHGEGFFRGIKRNGISSASLHTMSESRRSSYRPTPSVTNLEIGSYSNGGSVAPSHPKANASTPNFGQLESSGKNLRHDLLKVKISQDAPGGDIGDFHKSPSLRRVPSNAILRKIPTGSEATSILVGEIHSLSQACIAFVRLARGLVIPNLCEVPIPTRFMFILLGPTSCDLDFHEIGRALGTLMSNKDFHDVAYKTMVRRDILFAINEFLDDSIVLPPGDWSRKSLLPFEDLKEKSQSIAARKKREEMEKQQEAATKSELPLVPVEEKKAENPLEKTGKFFGGLVRDIKSRYPKYLSDITDFPNSVCIAATVFIYFAALSGAITFGGLYADKTKNQIGVSETLIATALAGIVFSMLSGQPLIIIGATGPVLLFDEAFYTFCIGQGINFLATRVWVGIWLGIIGIAVAMFELAFVVSLLTRFTEEIFASLISLLFIFESFAKLFAIYKQHPLLSNYCHEPNSSFVDMISNTTVTDITTSATTPLSDITFLDSAADRVRRSISETSEDPLLGLMEETDTVKKVNQPNTALMSTILMLGTFFIAYFLRHFRNSKFLGRNVRRALGDFGVPIAIVIMVIIDNAYDDAYTEKLSVPDGLSPSDSSLRGWIINPLGTEDNPVGIGMMFAAAIPALLVFILIFMETEICESIINKKCKKSLGGHHLDILLLCLINVFVTIMGAPWMPAATVRSVSHVSALTVLTTNQAPGEAATVAEIKEQRLSTFLVSVLIGVSVLMSPLLRKVPVAVLFGVFLYMGVSSMNGIQLFERMALLLKPSKHHPRVDYVRRVTTWKMHAFTIIQIFCLAILWVVKSTEAALAFPFFLILMIPIRKLLEKVFSPRELIALDGKDAQTTGEDDDEPDFYVEAKIL